MKIKLSSGILLATVIACAAVKFYTAVKKGKAHS